MSEVVDSGGGIRFGVVVMPVEGLGAIRSAVRCINIIAEFKKAVRAGETESLEFLQRQEQLKEFYAEWSGRRKGRRSSEIDYLSRHGEVVSKLSEWIKARRLPKGSRVVKNVLIDVGVEVGGQLAEIYEVKTSACRSDIYCAIGQLMVHGTAPHCQRFILLPQHDTVRADLADAMKRLGIHVKRFELDEVNARIVS